MSETDCPISARSRTHPERAALATGEWQLTYSELEREVTRLTDQLKGEGCKPGDPVALVAVNSSSFVTVLFAVLRMGGVAVLLSPRWPKVMRRAALRETGCLRRIDPGPSTGQCRIFSVSEREYRPEYGERLLEPGTILFSSGSTGKPKAILHRLSAHLWNARGSNRNIPLNCGDRWLLSLPVYHVGGLAILFRCFEAGATVVPADPGQPLPNTLHPSLVTHLSLVSTQLRRVLSAGKVLSNLKAVLLGGGPLPRGLVAEALQAGLPVYRTYGLTEMASQVATGSRPGREAPLRVLPYRELRISDSGEILVRGSCRFEGYVEAGRLRIPFDDQGWFSTGDRGRFDLEGGLEVLGRTDSRFVSGGENIYPEAIESSLLELPGIEAALVVPVQDEEFDRRPAAFVKTRGEWSPDRWKEELRERLPRHMVPIQFLQWPDREQGLKLSRKKAVRLLERRSADE